MSNYVISPSAIKDLNAIADYFLTTNVAAGEKLFEDFNNKCKKLAQFPNMGRSYSHIKSNLRGLPLKGYIIFYRVVDDRGVEIVRVADGRQDLDALFSSENDQQ